MLSGEDGLGSRSPGVLGGADKTVKSSILTDLAVCLSANEPGKFLMLPCAEESLVVVYLNYEGTASEFQDRICRIEKSRDVSVNRESPRFARLPAAR